MPFASAIPLRLYMNPWWWSVYTLGLSNTSWLYMSPSWWSVYTLGLSNTSWPVHVSKMMICIYPWPWQCVLTIHVSMMMICIYPWPRQYILTLCVSMMMICTYPLALAKRLDRMCLHDDLYILLDLAICSDRMCQWSVYTLYIPLALAICLDHVSIMICTYPWTWQYVLTTCVSIMMICTYHWPQQYVLTACVSMMMICIYPWPQQYILTTSPWWSVYTLGLGNTFWSYVSLW